MATVINKFMGERILCGLDIGTHKIKASLIRAKSPGACELLGVFEHPTGAWINGAIDLNKLTSSIEISLNGLSKKTGVKIREVQLGIPSECIEIRRSKAVIPLLDKGSKVITVSDVKKGNNQARLLGTKLDEEVLHDFPQAYRVDDLNVTLNPVGLYGRKLETELLLVVVSMNQVNDLVKAVLASGHEVDNLFFSSYAACEVALNNGLKQEGCVLVNIGAQTTDVVVFKDGTLCSMERLNVGGNSITNSIAQKMNLTFEIAEDIKKSYGMAAHLDTANEEEILIKNEKGYLPLKREALYAAIEPAVGQFTSLIESRFRGAVYKDLKAGIMIVGGGSLLPGLIERIEKSASLSTQIAKVNLAALQLGNAAVFAPAIGLAQLGFTKTFAYSISTTADHNWVAKISSRLRELYQEYF